MLRQECSMYYKTNLGYKLILYISFKIMLFLIESVGRIAQSADRLATAWTL
jgi:hypothetical protein